MSVFDIDTRGQRSIDSTIAGSSLDEVKPETFEGFGEGVGSGLMRGGAKAAQFIGMAGSTVPIAIDAFSGGTDAQDWYFENVIDEVSVDAVDYWTPQAGEVGKAGEIVGGLSEIALPLMVSAGNPSLMMGAQGIGTGLDLNRQGVDANTAATVGTIEALSLGIGFKIPFFGKTLTQRVGYGVGGNLALDVPTRAVQSQILESNEYAEQAELFDPLDKEALAISALTGAVFGGISHIGNHKVKTDDVAAIATANNARHFQDETAIGRPLDIDSSKAHQDSLDTAIRQLTEGEPVSIPEGIFDVDFVRRRNKDSEGIEKTLMDEYGDVISQLSGEKSNFVEQPRRFTLDDVEPIKAKVNDLDSLDILAAREALGLKPELSILDDDGQLVSAREALDKADLELKNAEVESKGYRAAVACFMRVSE
ncbi:MAG: hypothetical protein ACMZ64_07635 [Oleiphilus sp.]